MAGDFNLPDILLVDEYSSSNTQTTGSPFASCVSNNYLYQTVNEPKRIRSDQNSSLLNLVIVSSPEILISNDYLPPLWKKRPCYNFLLCLTSSKDNPKYGKGIAKVGTHVTLKDTRLPEIFLQIRLKNSNQITKINWLSKPPRRATKLISKFLNSPSL